MKLALVALLLVVPELAAASGPMVCGINSLTARERGRRDTLIHQLMPKAQVEETADGMQFTWADDATAYAKVTEFVGLERRCCPFLDFEMRFSGPDAPVVLVLYGDDEVKKFVKSSDLFEGDQE